MLNNRNKQHYWLIIITVFIFTPMSLIYSAPISHKNIQGQQSSVLQLNKANPPEGFKELRGVITMGIQPGGMFGFTSDVIALFDDGNYTSDLSRLFSEGISASMKKKPTRWGKWKMIDGELYLRSSGEKEFSETRGNWVARSAPSDQRLKGCYGNITSASETPFGGNSTLGNASSWCFKPNGRFAHSSTGFISSSGAVSGGVSSSSKRGGRYRIDGYTARFVYDDGTELVTAFCYLNEKKSHIAINGKRYMGHK